MSRSFGGRSFTTCPPIRTFPDVISSRPGDHPQRRRLSAAGRADEDHELAVLDLEVEIGDGLRPVGIDLRELLEGDLRHAISGSNLLASARFRDGG